jgi:hypothetical protein
MTDRNLILGPLTEAAADIRDHGYAIMQTRIERAPARYRGTQCTEPDGCSNPATLVTLALAEITDEPDGAAGFRFARDEDGEVIVVLVCDNHRHQASHDLYYELTARMRPDGIRAFDVPGQHMNWE